MDQLKEAVSSAAPGTGEVQRVIRESTFQPRAAAFTSLIQQCARARAWQKAVDVFHALQETPGLKVRLCTFVHLLSLSTSAHLFRLRAGIVLLARHVAEPESKASYVAQTTIKYL